MVRKDSGFTLVETLVAMAVLTIFLAAVGAMVQMTINMIGESRVRGEATRLATIRLEQVRNLPYIDVGTVGGIPAGSLVADEEIVVNQVKYRVRTLVLYIDDPFDGLAPNDMLPVDYKRVRVSVSWEGSFSSKAPVVLLTDVAPRGLETIIGGGTLSILVFDSQGKPVSDAVVRIEALNLNPMVLMDTTTDSFGRVIIPGAPICDSCYRVSSTKTGYTSDKTYGSDEVSTPSKPHVSVLEGRVSEVSFAIDAVSSLTLRATRGKLTNYAPFSGVEMVIRGTKEIGRTDQDDPVYKVDQKVTTGSGGQVVVNNLEWDAYTISLPANASVDFAGSWPFNPIMVGAAENATFTMVVENASANSLLLKMESEVHQPINLITAMISTGGYVATKSAGDVEKGDWSQIFFSNLNEDTYSLLITAEGYQTATASVAVIHDLEEYLVLATGSASP